MKFVILNLKMKKNIVIKTGWFSSIFERKDICIVFVYKRRIFWTRVLRHIFRTQIFLSDRTPTVSVVSFVTSCKSDMTGMKEPHTTPPSSLTYFLISSLVLLRSLIGFHPHSGQGNNHGNEAAYGGDFEAQRHWMELTLHLPISSWCVT